MAGMNKSSQLCVLPPFASDALRSPVTLGGRSINAKTTKRAKENTIKLIVLSPSLLGECPSSIDEGGPLRAPHSLNQDAHCACIALCPSPPLPITHSKHTEEEAMNQGGGEESVWGGNESCPSLGRRPNKIINTRGTRKKKKKGLGWVGLGRRTLGLLLLYERPSTRSAFFPSPESETPTQSHDTQVSSFPFLC